MITFILYTSSDDDGLRRYPSLGKSDVFFNLFHNNKKIVVYCIKIYSHPLKMDKRLCNQIVSEDMNSIFDTHHILEEVPKNTANRKTRILLW